MSLKQIEELARQALEGRAIYERQVSEANDPAAHPVVNTNNIPAPPHVAELGVKFAEALLADAGIAPGTRVELGERMAAFLLEIGSLAEAVQELTGLVGSLYEDLAVARGDAVAATSKLAHVKAEAHDWVRDVTHEILYPLANADASHELDFVDLSETADGFGQTSVAVLKALAPTAPTPAPGETAAALVPPEAP